MFWWSSNVPCAGWPDAAPQASASASASAAVDSGILFMGHTLAGLTNAVNRDVMARVI